MTDTNKAIGQFMRSSERLVKNADLREFFDNLTEMFVAAVQGESAEGEAVVKDIARVLKQVQTLPSAERAEAMGEIEQVAKTASPQDFVRFWQRLGHMFDDAAKYDAQEKVDIFDGMGRPEDPDKGAGSRPLPASSVPLPAVSAAVAKSLERLSKMTPADYERARTGQSLDGDGEPVRKGHQVSDPSEADMYMGQVNDETAVRKGLVKSGVVLIERVEAMAKQLAQATRDKRII